jgi:hypothetical protein
MMRILSLGLLIFGLSACTPITVIEPVLPAPEVIDLGFLPSTLDKRGYTPYFNQRTLIFEANNGESYSFQMSQPIINEEYRFRDVFLHPTVPGKEVAYFYTGEKVSFEWTSASLGARLVVVFEPAFCGDPMLETSEKLHEHLKLIGSGFNNGDITIQLPALDMNLTEDRICGEGRFLGTIELGDKTFNHVNYARQELGDRYLEVYYSTEKGIVAFGTTYLFAVLDRAF